VRALAFQPPNAVVAAAPWESTFPDGSVKKNDAGAFKGLGS